MSDPIPEKTFDKNSRGNVIFFALATSLVCSLLITAAASGLRERQMENVALDKKVNLLRAANLVAPDKKPAPDRIRQLYDTHIREVAVDAKGNITPDLATGDMRLYLYQTEGKVDGYILPVNTRGLWGKIYGYLAFENDGQTVSGFSVYSHSETPGLGGEIESAWFQNNFKGKKILNSQNKFVSVGIAKGEAENLPKDLRDHYVDGISGATLTGKYLSEGLQDTLIKYEPVSISFRQKKGDAKLMKTLEEEG